MNCRKKNKNTITIEISDRMVLAFMWKNRVGQILYLKGTYMLRKVGLDKDTGTYCYLTGAIEELS